MSLPDGAEYWQDIKASSNRYHPTHASINVCHLTNGSTSNLPEHIDCHYCKKLMTPESIADMAKLESNRIRNLEHRTRQKRKKIKDGWLKKYPNNPICECGFPMLERTNRKDQTKFFGCCQYPICKNTKSIKS